MTEPITQPTESPNPPVLSVDEEHFAEPVLGIVSRTNRDDLIAIGTQTTFEPDGDERIFQWYAAEFSNENLEPHLIRLEKVEGVPREWRSTETVTINGAHYALVLLDLQGIRLRTGVFYEHESPFTQGMVLAAQGDPVGVWESEDEGGDAGDYEI